MAKAKQEEKQSKLDIELAGIEKDYGKGSVMLLSKRGGQKIDVISSGSLKLDIATGIGGFPRGRIVEFMGWESSGKSTISLQTMANAHSLNLNTLLIDGEHSFDETYAKKLGVEMNKMYINQIDEGGGEQCYDIAERMIRTKEVGVVVIDSQTSLLPKKALSEEDPKSIIGLHARMMSFRIPRIVAAAGAANCLVIFVSQFREKIGMMFGNPETTNGGNALKFYAHMRVDFRKTILKEEDEAYANKTTCKIVKNKMSAPHKKAEFRINFGTGVDNVHELFEEAVERGIISQAGSWYGYGEQRLGQGEATILEMLADNNEFLLEVNQRVIKHVTDEKSAAEKGEQAAQTSGDEEELTERLRAEERKHTEAQELLHASMGQHTRTAEEMLRDGREDIHTINGEFPSRTT